MKILYSPQFKDNDTIDYQFNGNKITVTYQGQTDTFDFSNLPDGKALSYGKNPSIISTLPIQPVVEAEIINGELQVKLLKFVPFDAQQEDLYPDWVTV